MAELADEANPFRQQALEAWLAAGADEDAETADERDRSSLFEEENSGEKSELSAPLTLTGGVTLTNLQNGARQADKIKMTYEGERRAMSLLKTLGSSVWVLSLASSLS